MDFRRMDVEGKSTTSGRKPVGDISYDEYKCGLDKLPQLEATLEKVMSLEYWDPYFQGWESYLRTYLGSGISGDLAVKYYKDLVEKQDLLLADPTRFSPMFGEVLKLNGAPSVEAFENCFYNDIVEFCQGPCRFFIGYRKQIRAQLYQPNMYIDTLRDLLEQNTWRCVMCGIILYRHCQIDGFKWPEDLVSALEEKIQEWITKFEATFDEVVEFIGTPTRVYGWYCPTVKTVIHRAWSTALMLKDRPPHITMNDATTLPDSIMRKFIPYINNSPVVYDDPFADQTVWDSVSQVFYSDDPNAPDFSEKAYKALCVPRYHLNKMIDTLFDFYWMVEDGLLTARLYTRKQLEFEESPEHTTLPKDYLVDLYFRGFPEMK